MYKPLCIIFLVLIISIEIGNAQNLLYNGDFEIYDTCPIGYTDQFQNEISKCIGWTHPTWGTSDYFNQCANGTYAGITTNTLGYQQPYSGSGYLGAFLANFTGGAGTDGYNGPMWWEYVQGQFIHPLEANRIYQIKFHISLAEIDLAIKEFGAYISTNAISSPNTANLTVTPQLVFTSPTYFSDTTNWVMVEGLYLAQGGEKYITIGNFKSNESTDTLRIQSFGNPEPLMAYYFIDAAEFNDVTGENIVSNTFTPNGDGINDVWKLSFLLSDYIITIYNRWGNLILQEDAYNFSWDGKTKEGKDCSDGVYYYIIKSNKNASVSIKGFIQLLR